MSSDPIRYKQYQIPYKVKEAACKEIRAMINVDITKSSESLYACSSTSVEAK